ncbi:MAG: hypothetical protein IJ890_05190 [Clostridia bacterium]|nr:hypothetical protein [Clostridia bacterium]
MKFIKKYTYTILKHLCVLLTLTFIYTASLGITYTFPKKNITKNIKSSVRILKKEGEGYSSFFTIPKLVRATKYDNFTDSKLLNVALDKEENASIMEKIVKNAYYQSSSSKQITNLDQALKEDTKVNSEYIRYWFGSETVIKFLLIFTDLAGIRYINIMLLSLLFIYVLYLISKKIETKYAVAYAISILLMNFWIIPMSLQYAPVMYITLIATIAVIALYNSKYKEKLPYLFFIIGSCTAFFDLLTYPLITLGYPVIILILLKSKYEENNNIRETIFYWGKLAIIWGIAYGITYVTKWALASAVYGQDYFTKSFEQLFFRMDMDGAEKYSKKDVIYRNLKCYFHLYNCILLGIAAICSLPMIIKKFDKTKLKLITILPLLACSIAPYIWYVVLANHSYIHCWMTYRIQGITVFGILSIILSAVNMEKNKKLLPK